MRSCSAPVHGTALFFSLLFVLLLPTSVDASSRQSRTHVVAEGQRLGSIAKRYRVSVEALCTANAIRARDPIKPGQRLVIPSESDRDGSRARAAAQARSASAASKPSAEKPMTPFVHKVHAGQRLESIARRYKVTVDALCKANRITARSIIRPGQSLTIPGLSGSSTDASRAKGYRAYFKTPSKKGFVELVGYTQKYRGHVFDKRGRVLPAALAGFSRVLGMSGSRPDPDRRLLRVLVDISDRFGGRPLRIVSGYRSSSYFEDSRHKSSRAVDFSIPGIPNDALKDYLRTLGKLGVGYYPNSSFVHLDVREYAAYWVDYAGPGEAPRSTVARRQQATHSHEHEPEAVTSTDDSESPTPSTVTASVLTKAAESDSTADPRRQAPRDVPSTVPAQISNSRRVNRGSH